MSARDEILERVRKATVDLRETEAEVEWVYNQPTPMEDVLDVFEENILDYKAWIQRATAAHVPEAIVTALRELGASSVVVPDGIDPAWVEGLERAEMTIVRDDPPLSHEQLNEIDAVLTGCAVAGADSGTICLDHAPDQGRRALTLVPDRHICVVRAEDVVSDIPEVVTRLKPAAVAGNPITWISGGSATSDIELSRVEGVHGPRQLFVILQESDHT